jgi:hypothetical protein
MLYKFLRPDHADGLLRRGAVRIGTLYEFRREEEHGTEIGDAGEGIASRMLFTSGAKVWSDRTQPKFSRSFVKIGPGIDVTFENCHFVQREQSPDCWLYCVSTSFSEAMLERSPYSACVRIDFPRHFFRALSRVVRPAAFLGVHACQYEGRAFMHDHGPLSPALLKDPVHAYQCEARAIWQPSGEQPIAPILCDVPSLIGSCTRIC